MVTTLAACAASPIDFTTKHCPCADGYVCNALLDVCLERDESYVAAVLADDPLLYYRLSDTEASTIRDASGHGLDTDAMTYLDGVITFGEPGAIAGDPDGALRLAGEGQAGDSSKAWVRLPAVTYWNGDFTVEAWVRLFSTPLGGSTSLLFVDEAYLESGYRTGWTSELKVRIWSDEGGGTAALVTSGTLSLTEFRHVVFVRQGSQMTVYLDAVADVSAPFDIVVPVDGGGENGIGACHGEQSSAVFDEFAIYETALSAERIATHYRLGRGL